MNTPGHTPLKPFRDAALRLLIACETQGIPFDFHAPINCVRIGGVLVKALDGNMFARIENSEPVETTGDVDAVLAWVRS